MTLTERQSTLKFSTWRQISLQSLTARTYSDRFTSSSIALRKDTQSLWRMERTFLALLKTLLAGTAFRNTSNSLLNLKAVNPSSWRNSITRTPALILLTLRTDNTTLRVLTGSFSSSTCLKSITLITPLLKYNEQLASFGLSGLHSHQT